MRTNKHSLNKLKNEGKKFLNILVLELIISSSTSVLLECYFKFPLPRDIKTYLLNRETFNKHYKNRSALSFK